MDKTQLSSEQVTRSSGSNFVSSFRFLPKAKREALTTVYAFCRLSDDIVDNDAEHLDMDELRSRLEEWRQKTSVALQGKGGHPVLRELHAVVQKYRIPQEYFSQLIEGVEMDLEKKSYETFNELFPYCYGVASVVGLICLEIFGYKNSRAKDYAVNLGIAFQLTNILRDMKSDMGRGRVYIPMEDLDRFGLGGGGFSSIFSSPAGNAESRERFEKLVLFECERAESYYRKAKENLTMGDRSNLLAAEMMCAVYHTILKKIRRNPLAVMEGKVSLSKFEKIFSIFRAWMLSKVCKG